MKTLQTTYLDNILQNRSITWLFITVSTILMLIDNLLKMPILIGGWHIVLYVTLLTPLVYLIWQQKTLNPYTKWFIPLLAIWIIDMFIFNNLMVQLWLPLVFYIVVILLYLSSMQNVSILYQTFIPRITMPLHGLSYMKLFLDNLIIQKNSKSFYKRIGISLIITLPFFAVFLMLLLKADSQYSHYINQLFMHGTDIELHYLITMPLYFMLYLFLFIYSLFNHQTRTVSEETKRLDLLIVSIFLGMINLLFFSFIILQIPFLLNSYHIPHGMNIAEFAREGFFQLMAVMGLVIVIFLFIMKRYQGEKPVMLLLAGLLVQTIVMGIVSLKKMCLYQEIKGVTVLRYYVEWFDYFLLFALLLGTLFLIQKYPFVKLLNILTITGLFTFTLIVSLNIDAMVANHNIQKFEHQPEKLDKAALSQLSIDALPVMKKYGITLEKNEMHRQERNILIPWYVQTVRNHCDSFATYHYGYCTILQQYGE